MSFSNVRIRENGAEKEARILPVVVRSRNSYSGPVLAGCGGHPPGVPSRMNGEQSPGSVLSSLWQQIRAVLDLVLDLSFKRFVTPRLVRMLYVLSLLAAVFYAISWMMSGFWGLITAPVAFLLYLIVARVAVELILAIFRIAEKLAPLSDGDATTMVQDPASKAPR